MINKMNVELSKIASRKYPTQKRVNTVDNSLMSNINYKSHCNEEEMKNYYNDLSLHKDWVEIFGEKKEVDYIFWTFFETRRKDNSLARFKMSHPK